jgi:uncharacterized membrane protein (UPF0127 family)
MDAMAKVIQDHFRSLARDHGAITETDYFQACVGLPLEVAVSLGEWLATSGLKLKRGIGPQYEQEIKEKIENPNINNVKDTKYHTNPNRNKKQKSKIKYPARPNAQTWGHYFQDMQRSLVQEIERYHTDSPYFQQYLQAAGSAETVSMLQEVWDAMAKGEPPAGASGAPAVTRPPEKFREFVEMPEDDEGALELAHLKDPVSAHVRHAAENVYQAKLKQCVTFDNGARFTVDVADTLDQKAAGLEVFDSLAQGYGLLFPFDPPESVTFHMGKVKFPIDIVFLLEDPFGKNLIASKIIRAVVPGSLDHWGHDKVRYVLELPGGTCKRTGIDINSVCHIGKTFEVA